MTLTSIPAFGLSGTYGTTAPPAEVHFGGNALGNLAAPIIQKAMQNKKVQQAQKNGRLKQIIIANVIGLTALFPAIFFNPQIAQKLQSSSNDNVTLSSIQQPPSNEELARRVNLTLKTGQLIGDRSLVYDLARLGYVREVISEGPDATKGKLVLKNGRAIDIPLDDSLRTTLREEYDVPTVHSLGYGIPLDPKVAAGVAAAITNVLLMAFMALSALIGKLRKPDEKKEELGDRFYTEQIGRFIVANELGVTRAPIGPGAITEEKDLYSDVDALTRDEVWKRMVVLPSGYIAEHQRYGGDVSAMSAKKSKDLLEVARVAVAEMGLCMDRNIDPIDIAKMTQEEQEELAVKLAKSAFVQAREILQAYSTEQLDQLGEALQLFKKDFSKADGRALLNGEKTLEQLKEEKGLFNKDEDEPVDGAQK